MTPAEHDDVTRSCSSQYYHSKHRTYSKLSLSQTITHTQTKTPHDKTPLQQIPHSNYSFMFHLFTKSFSKYFLHCTPSNHVSSGSSSSLYHSRHLSPGLNDWLILPDANVRDFQDRLWGGLMVNTLSPSNAVALHNVWRM